MVLLTKYDFNHFFIVYVFYLQTNVKVLATSCDGAIHSIIVTMIVMKAEFLLIILQGIYMDISTKLFSSTYMVALDANLNTGTVSLVGFRFLFQEQ